MRRRICWNSPPAWISLLLGGRLASALVFYFQADSEEARRPVVSTTILGAAALGLLAAVCCGRFSGRLLNLSLAMFRRRYVRIVFVCFPACLPWYAIFTLYRVENGRGLYTAMSLLRLALHLPELWCCALLRWRVAGMMLAQSFPSA